MDLDNKNLIAWLPFNTSPTEDVKGNNWQAYGNPTVGTTNAFNGKALQLDGSSYLKLSNVMLGGQDFYIDGWMYATSSSSTAVLIDLNPPGKYSTLQFVKLGDDTTIFFINSDADSIQNHGNSYTSTINAVGERVHFKLLYRYSTNRGMYLYINDQLAASSTGSDCPQYTRQAFDIYIGMANTGRLGFVGYLDELRIYDGTVLASGNGTPPTIDEYQNITQSFDVDRRLLPATTWRYDNRGDADDLIVGSTVLTNLPATMSKTGTAFYQTQRVKCFDIPATPEIWLKFDVYFDGTNRWRAYNAVSSSDMNGLTSQTNERLYFFSTGMGIESFVYSAGLCKPNTLQTVLLHMKAGATDGFVEAWVDGTFIHRYTDNVNNGEDFADIFLQSDASSTFFSNVIISNVPIGLDEDALHSVYFDVERLVSTYIYFKPEMFISFIEAGFDVDETYDVERVVIKSVEVNEIFDVERRLVFTEQETYDVLRIVTQPTEVDVTFDVERRLANEVQITADVERTVMNGTTLIADVVRNVANVYEISFDVERRIKNQAEFFFDVERIVLNRVDFTVDVERKILSATTGQRMLSRISPIYDESTFMKNFFQALGVEWDKVRRYFITLREQRFIHTVDWGIEYLEHKYSVVPDRTLTLEERRARLGLRSFKKYPLNPAVLEKFARDNFDLEVYLDESEASYIWMVATNFTNESFNGYMKYLLREKPAHLALAVLLYMTLYTGRARDDGLPKLYAGIVEMLTGHATIQLPKPKNQRLNIYAGVVQVWRGSMTIGSKTKPFEHSY